jgi:hypothetical protein
MPLPDVAAQLKISDQTLETYCKNLKDKLKLPDDAALENYALKCKRCFDTSSVDTAAAFFHCALQLECCEWGKPPQFKPVQPEPRSGFHGKPR